MKTIRTKLAAVTFLLCLSAPAFAGKGGSAQKIQAAYASGSVDAIIAEVERTESLMCSECIGVMTRMTEDSRYAVREVAGWWFAKRPTLSNALTEQFVGALATGDSVKVRNAADFLGAARRIETLPQLAAAIGRQLEPEAKLAIVRAVGQIGSNKGNAVLTVAFTDGTAAVRAAAIRTYRDLRNQTDFAPAIALLGDADAGVRAEAATVAGGRRLAAATARLEALVVGDADAIVRKNAAWALGRIGSATSRAALTQAANDRSAYVRGVAQASLASLR